MKISILSILVCLSTSIAQSQTIRIAEPPFDGTIIYANDTVGNGIPLEKLVSSVKSTGVLKTMVSGKATSTSYVKNCCSTVRIPQKPKLSFLVPYVDRQDPLEYLKVFQMTSEKKTRTVKIGEVKMKIIGQGDPEMADSDYLKFTYQKYGERSYLITIDSLPPGEYAMTLQTQKFGMFYLFGID